MGYEDNSFQNENHTAIERVINELNETSITFDNYKRFGDRVDNNINIILAQIENTRTQFTEIYEDFVLQTKSSDFKRVSMDNLVPKDVFKMVIAMNKILKDTISWQEMKSSMYEIMYKKIYSIIDEANALTIKKEAIQEMRDMEKERNKIITDTVTHKFGMIDERFDSIIKSILESQKNERTEMMNSFERLILKFKIKDAEQIDNVQKSPQIYVQETQKPTTNQQAINDKIQAQKEQDERRKIEHEKNLEYMRSITVLKPKKEPDEQEKKQVSVEEPIKEKKIDDIEDMYENFENRVI